MQMGDHSKGLEQLHTNLWQMRRVRWGGVLESRYLNRTVLEGESFHNHDGTRQDELHGDM